MAAPREIDARGRHVLPGGIDLHVHLTPAGLLAPRLALGRRLRPRHGRRAARRHHHRRQHDPPRRRRDDGRRRRPRRRGRRSARPLRLRAASHPHGALGLASSPRSTTWPPPVTPRSRSSCRSAASTATSTATSRRPAPGRPHRRPGDAALRGRRRHRLLLPGAARRGPAPIPATTPRRRPVAAERAATERAVAFSEITGAAICVVHLASAAALDSCRAAQARGLPVYVETRPLYLHLTRERFEEAGRGQRTPAPRRCATPPTSTPSGRPSPRARSPPWPPTTRRGASSRSSTRPSTPPTCARGWPSCRPRCPCCGGRACAPGGSRCAASWRSPPPTRPSWPASSPARARSRWAATPTW